jgi:hypothetical protein
VTTSDRWRRVEQILDDLLDLPPHARDARLDALSAGDAALRDEVSGLLSEGAKSGGILDGSVATLIGGVLDGAAPSRQRLD